MNGYKIKVNKVLAVLIYALGLTTSTTCLANGPYGGGGHGGPYHGGPNNGGPYPYHGGGYGGFYGPSIIIGVPGPDPYYYPPPPACETVRVCDEFGDCWFEEDCN